MPSSEIRDTDKLRQLIDDQIVRGFQHVEWLSQLAVVLETANAKRGGGTPFQSGAVQRIRMAARYIEMLERETRDLTRQVAGLEEDIKFLKGSGDNEEGR